MVPVVEYFLGLDSVPYTTNEGFRLSDITWSKLQGEKWNDFICLFLFFKILVSIIMSLDLQRFLSNFKTVKEIRTILFTRLFFSDSLGKLAKSKGLKKGPEINGILWRGSWGLYLPLNRSLQFYKPSRQHLFYWLLC